MLKTEPYHFYFITELLQWKRQENNLKVDLLFYDFPTDFLGRLKQVQ